MTALVDVGLLLLLQQRNELSLRAYVPPDAPVHVVQVADDGVPVRRGVGEGSENESQLRIVNVLALTSCR